MITVLSPAKKLTEKDASQTPEQTAPVFLKESSELMDKLKKMSAKKLGTFMSISPKLADMNFERFQQWDAKFSSKNAHPASLTFDGEVYWGLEAETFKKGDFKFAQKHLRILSGLHGILRPLDLIKPYRLEMGSKLKVGRANNLYDYWGDKITDYLDEDLSNQKERVIVDLASKEYFKSVNMKKLGCRVITMHFRDWKNGKYKPLFAYVKRARGKMAAYIVKNRIIKSEKCKGFDLAGYSYNASLSTDDDWVFTRDKVQ